MQKVVVKRKILHAVKTRNQDNKKPKNERYYITLC